MFLSRGGIDAAACAPEDWVKTFAVNVMGVVNATRALRPALARLAVICSGMGAS